MRPARSTFLIAAAPLLFLCSSTSGAEPLRNGLKPCTIFSPTTGAYFDLNAIALSPPVIKDGKKVHNKDREESWHAKGYDYPANFTLNICAPVIEDLKDVVGVDESKWANVSAYYTLDGKMYSIGQQSSELVFRGRSLVLNYTDGSPCPALTSSKASGFGTTDQTPNKDKVLGQGDDNGHDKDKNQDDKTDDRDKHDGKKGGNSSDHEPADSSRRKSTILSFLCDRDLVSPAASVTFVGTLDSCTYSFQVRSAAACGGFARTDGGLGPAGVFGVIALIAIAVYVLGGCAYQRTVMHQRGWRQCPNYSMWASAVSFLRDVFIILFASLCRCFSSSNFKSPTGYSPFSNYNHNSNDRNAGGFVSAFSGRRGSGGGAGGRGRRTDVDEENRLIDQLDEEWDD
ncbi:vacuolar sorting receptor [Histoplasma capsulatum var. duboisii H88]|uniref:Vacuolar sorting receptor n=1 Tax=Ajellomyces capsulatus (strain H88) TaxID=544711 RepID=A0A8A1LG85_AJEC8|nr:vacuolar sorting receptor [Histoplasma capsulatum var. duboisii H88]